MPENGLLLLPRQFIRLNTLLPNPGQVQQVMPLPEQMAQVQEQVLAEPERVAMEVWLRCK